MDIFRKHDARPGRIAAEVAGLRWLAQAHASGGAAVVPVLAHGSDYLEEPRLASLPPTAQSAEHFGHALAYTHAAGASHLGAPPPGVTKCWMGDAPLEVITKAPARQQSWGAYYTQYRLIPHADASRWHPQERRVLDALFERLMSGDFDHAQPQLVEQSECGAARTHGDLWSGNLVWTDKGVVLIDPAAQGGHAEEDLAALAVFGAPYTQRIWDAYNEASPLADGWEERIPLHQLHILLIHAQLFGRGYADDVIRIAKRFQ